MIMEVDLKRGLKGVYIDRTQTSFIDGDIGKLLYRGYSIHDLAEKSTFEETVYLLLYGKLPIQKELDAFDAQLRANRAIPAGVVEVIRLVKDADPMDVLRTAVSALATFDPEVADNSQEATLRKGIRLTAQAPTIVTAHARIRAGKQPIEPNPKLSHAANFLYMLNGREPPADEAKLLDKDFVLHAEHGINASAFAARLVASTIADLHCAVVAGIATLKGPAHGGAAGATYQMAQEIGSEDRVEAYIQGALRRGERIMGFGHRVYRVEDPRAHHLRDGCLALGAKKGQPQWFRILSRVEELMKPYASRGIAVNVDFWAGAIYHLLEIPDDLFVSVFAMGRIPGWTAQVQEQFADNVLIRPLLLYEGPMDLEYVPIAQRK
ncbi:MAG: citrate (Si)-synthase [Chloroflexi bacterium]|nr:citrate (Si)-synthase [Chloroflexota bacterium]